MKKGAEYKKEVMGFDQAIFTFLDQCRQNLTHYVEIQKITAKLQRVRYMELLNQGFNEEQALKLVKDLKPFDVA